MTSPRASTPSSPSAHLRTERLARSAGLSAAATLVSRVLGLARDTVLAGLFGAGNEMDAFLVAFRIPNLVRDLFAEGATSAAFVPAFTRRLTLGGKADAWRLGNNVLTALLLVTGATVAIGCIFSRALVSSYAGGYAEIPGKLDLTILLTRVMLPFLMLITVASAFMGMLNSLRHYFVPALAPAAFNVATILCAVVLTPVMPALGQPPIVAIAIGTLLGGVGQIAVQWPALRREGFRFSLLIDRHDPGLREVLLLMGPGTLGLAATQANLFVITLLATGQGTGAVSWLVYGFRLMYLPLGLFGVSIATAVLPAIARRVALGDSEGAIRTLTRGLALMLIVNVPATVGLLVLATPIVQLLLERGQFLPADTMSTAAAVRCYAIGLVGYSAARIASPVFYALGQGRTAVALSTTSVAINLVLSLVFVRTWGFRGLALATALAAIVNGGFALILLRRRLGEIGTGHLAATFVKIAVASALMAVAVRWAEGLAITLYPGVGVTVQAARLLSAIVAGLIALTVCLKLLRFPELEETLSDARQRLAP